MPDIVTRGFRFRLTPPGWCFLALTLAFGGHAMVAGNNLVFLIFALLAGFGLSQAVLTAFLPFGLTLRRRLPESTHVGQRFHYTLEIRSSRRRPVAAGLHVEEVDSRPNSTPGRLSVGSLSPGETRSLHFEAVAHSRGWLTFDEVRLLGSYAFGLCEAERRVALPQRLVAYPPRWLMAKSWSLAQLGGAVSGVDPGAGLSADGPEFLGLREYQPGDHPRTVHWHSLQRLPDQMLVRLFEPPRHRQVTLVLDSFFTTKEEGRCRAAFEDNICLALALVECLLAHRYAVRFLGFAGGPRVFPLDPAQPHLKELRLWLALLEPERKRSRSEWLGGIAWAPGERPLVLCLPQTPRSRFALPAGAIPLSAESLKAHVLRPGAAPARATVATEAPA